MSYPLPKRRHPLFTGSFVCALMVLSLTLISWPGSATPRETGPVFQFAPTSTVFEAARGDNAEALARVMDLLHRVGGAADFEVVLLGSVTPACPTPLCPEPLRLRSRVEAVTQALYRAWPVTPASFPAERLRWTFEIADHPDHAHQLRLRLNTPEVRRATPDCPFTVDWREPDWPLPLEPSDEPLWLTLDPTGRVVELVEDAWIRIRYHGTVTQEVEITLENDVSVSVLHSGLWQHDELRLRSSDLGGSGERQWVLRGRILGDDLPPTRALAGTPSDAIRGIGDRLLAWPADSTPGPNGFPPRHDLGASEHCSIRLQMKNPE